jgi:hypothetical protein
MLIAGALAWGLRGVAREIRAARQEARRARLLTILELYRPGLDLAQNDPRALIVWHPLARIGRTLLPDEFADLDRATGATFPFAADRFQEAHAKWTADWLAWERAHDAEYKRRAAAAERDVIASDEKTARPLRDARLDAIEQEKLELYQRRYEEYVRVAKALRAMCDAPL